MKQSPIVYRIREAEEKDFDGIITLLKEFALFQKTPHKMKMTAEQMRKDNGLFHFLIAEVEDDTLAGYVAFFQAYYSWSGKAFYVDDLYVKEEYRGAGVGNKLLQTVIEKARREDCKKVRWQVSHWNNNAIAFYKSIGASVDDTEWNCDLIL